MKKPETSDETKRFPVEMFLVVLAAVVLLTGALGYSFRVDDRLRKEHLALVDAALEIRLEATIANLFLEEMLVGNRSGKTEDVMHHLDSAAWYAAAILVGGISPDGKVIPSADPAVRPDIAEVMAQLEAFRVLAGQRFASFQRDGLNTSENEAYRVALADFAGASDGLQHKLRHRFEKEAGLFRFFQTLVGVVLGVAVTLFGWFFYRYERQRDAYLAALKARLSRIKRLRGILPICSACKRIRDVDGCWKPVENYIRHHTEAEFSHSICPACVKKLYPGFH
ncbi:MAG: hypothetical protein R6X05_01955 [Desulfobacterales bacterium]